MAAGIVSSKKKKDKQTDFYQQTDGPNAFLMLSVLMTRLSAALVNALLLPTWVAVFKEIFFHLLQSAQCDI